MGPGDHKGAEDHNGAWDGKHLGNTKGFEDKKAAWGHNVAQEP